MATATTVDVYDELIAMDTSYMRGVAILATEMGQGKYSKLAIKYFTCFPFMRGGGHWLKAKLLADEEARFQYCAEQRRIYERPEIQ